MIPRNPAIRYLIRRAAAIYTAGPTVDHARSICEQLGANGIATTVCYWDGWPDSPNAVSDAYLRILELAKNLRSDFYLSVKAPAFGFDMDLLRQILLAASRTNTPVHFDSLAPDTVDRTFDLIDQARRIYPNIGCTLPARWRRSSKDAERAIDLGLRVRIVKGQWSGLNGDDMNPQEGFRRLVESLTAKGARHVAIATHNPLAARNALLTLKNAEIPCELELLHSLPRHPMLKVAREFNARVRVYVPYGHPALPYRLREIHHDPRIAMWFIRDLVRSAPSRKENTEI